MRKQNYPLEIVMTFFCSSNFLRNDSILLGFFVKMITFFWLSTLWRFKITPPSLKIGPLITYGSNGGIMMLTAHIKYIAMLMHVNVYTHIHINVAKSLCKWC